MKKFTIVSGGTSEQRAAHINKLSSGFKRTQEILYKPGSSFEFSVGADLVIIGQLPILIMQKFLDETMELAEKQSRYIESIHFVLECTTPVYMKDCEHIENVVFSEGAAGKAATTIHLKEKQVFEILSRFDKITEELKDSDNKFKFVCRMVEKHKLDFYEGAALMYVLNGKPKKALKFIRVKFK